MNLSISSPKKPLITHNWKYFLGRNINHIILSYSKLDHLTSWREWKIGTARGENRCWTSHIYTEKTPDFRRFKYSFNKRSLHLFLLYPWKNEKFNQNVIHWTITLITPLFGIVHFKTNYNYRLSNHCFINELILVTYALISNAVEKIRGDTKRQLHIHVAHHDILGFTILSDKALSCNRVSVWPYLLARLYMMSIKSLFARCLHSCLTGTSRVLFR